MPMHSERRNFQAFVIMKSRRLGNGTNRTIQYNILLSGYAQRVLPEVKKNSGGDRTAKLKEPNTALPDTILSRGLGSEEMSEIARLGCGKGEVVNHTTLSDVQATTRVGNSHIHSCTVSG